MARVGFVTGGVSVTSRTKHCACAVKADEEGNVKVSRAEFLRVASLVTAGIGTSLLPQATLAKKDSDDQTSNEDKNLFQSVTGGLFQKKEVKRKSPAAEEAKAKAAPSVDIEADIGDDMMKRLESRRKARKE
uniref:Uncharacterized protein n=1 Tax=Rhodosorus marinus TaxID=101924 RepID=A0A7S3EFP4_9RHOD|mmetsp:Transcript_32759/g.128671  ORF Transcript_32759/g.128671 Transcript_32759/m.128671 type:complete len:132 (+) Transcript_32759:617-1012(+)